MNLRQIEAFKAMMELGTVKDAALRLDISQPAMSKLLQHFQRAAGITLFTRERGRLSPTPEARLLYDEVERVFHGVSRVRQAADEIRLLRRAIVSVGVIPALSVGFVQRVLASLELKKPGLRITIHARETSKLVDLLTTGQIDIMFSMRAIEHPEVRCELLCAVPVVCILPPRHRLAARREIQCTDLAGERFASFRHDSIMRHRIDQAFEEAKVRRNIVLESPMVPTICAFVAEGLGVSLVNPLYVDAFRHALKVRPFSPKIPSEIFMATPRLRRQSALGAAVADVARSIALRAD